jgi:hypothetical protein
MINMSIFFIIYLCLTYILIISRHHQSKYFRGSRLLNYPNDDTTKQSRKYVKSLRNLIVSEILNFINFLDTFKLITLFYRKLLSLKNPRSGTNFTIFCNNCYYMILMKGFQRVPRLGTLFFTCSLMRRVDTFAKGHL